MFDEFSQTFTNLGYTSCTTNINIALRFSGHENFILRFTLTPNILFYKYNDDKSWLPENEYLLQRGIRFEIVNANDNIFDCIINLN